MKQTEILLFVVCSLQVMRFKYDSCCLAHVNGVQRQKTAKRKKKLSNWRLNVFLYLHHADAELQTESENLATRLFYMNNAKEDIRSDIAVMKRAAEKAEAEVNQAESSKKHQVSLLWPFVRYANVMLVLFASIRFIILLISQLCDC